MDGVDKGLFRVPDFVSALGGLLADAAPSPATERRVPERGEWPHAQGEALLGLWGARRSRGIYELCPVRRADAARMADRRRVDSQRFLEVVGERQVECFAARPVTLGFLLKEFATHHTLPRTHRKIYELGCRGLCAEHDPVQAEVRRAQRAGGRAATIDEQLSAALRAAALLLLAGKAAVHAPDSELDESLPSDLPISAMAGDFPPVENVLPLSPEVGSGAGTAESDRPIATSFVPNRRGEITEEIAPDGPRRYFAYDGMGRRIWAETRTASGLRLHSELVHYNLNSDPAWIDSPRFGPEDYVWLDDDCAGRLREETRWRIRNAFRFAAALQAAPAPAKHALPTRAETLEKHVEVLVAEVGGSLLRRIQPEIHPVFGIDLEKL